MPKKIINKPGDQYFDWTLIKKIGVNKYRQEEWLCECRCGRRLKKVVNQLRAGRAGQRCQSCAAKVRREPRRPDAADRSGGEGRMIKAQCPRCGVLHLTRIFWTGKGLPRLFCPACKLIMDRQYMTVQPAPAVMRGPGGRRTAA